MTIENKLRIKPCPFCGGEAKTAPTHRPIGGYCVYCTKCDATSGAHMQDEERSHKEIWINEQKYERTRKTAEQNAILAWNRRIEQNAINKTEVKTIIIPASVAERMITEAEV